MTYWENDRARSGGARGRSDRQTTSALRRGSLRLAGALVLAALLPACGTQPLDAAIDAEELGTLMTVGSTTDTTTIRALDGQTVSGSVVVRVETARTVREVRFVLDDEPVPVAIDRAAPFEIQLDTATLSDGAHTLAALTTAGSATKLRVLATAEFVVANAAVDPDPDVAPTDPAVPEPGDPEPADPEPADPEPGDPEPGDPEPADPEPGEPEPEDPGPVDPDPTIVYDGPLTITQGGTYSGNWESLDPAVPAIVVRTSQPVIIDGANVRSAGHLISAPWTNANLTVRNVTGTAIAPQVSGKVAGRFLHVEGYVRVVVENSFMSGTSGIYLNASAPGATVQVLRNRAHNIDGRRSDGAGGYSGASYVQFVQFNQGQALVATEVAWNEVINDPYLSRVEDVVSVYKTSGTATDPIRIHDNYIQGAYAADPVHDGFSGGGIMVGDGGGAYVHVYRNHVVATSNYGIAISGGHDNRLYDNRVVACGLLPDGAPIAAQNVGMYVWDIGDDPSFGANTGSGNTVGWSRTATSRNDWWVPDATSWTDNVRIDSGQPIGCTAERDELVAWQHKVDAEHVVVGPTGSATLLAALPSSQRN